MKVNYVLMYGIPYVRYKEFETFEDISKFLLHKRYGNYSIFKKIEDREEIEMIYRDNDIHYLENFVKEQDKEIERLNNIIKKLEKWLVEWREMLDCPDFYEEGIIDCINETLNKLQELKGSDKK